ncbi:MAG: hypothetical protein CMJ49_13320 [Planctomycetaceae bacterium]|nr:hypothetical protein [Planctomycetaceae bacterium]
MLKPDEHRIWPALIVCAAIGLASLAHADITIIAQEGDAPPDDNGTFSGFFAASVVLNDAGQVAFYGFLDNTSGGLVDNEGLFRGGGGALTQVTRGGDPAPDGNGTFQSYFLPAINQAGQLAFKGVLTGTSGGGADSLGIFAGSGGSLTQVVRTGEAPPEGGGTFSNLDDGPKLNDMGQVAFKAWLTGTTENQGIYVGAGGTLTRIAREGDPAHDGDGIISSSGIVSGPAINNLGQVAIAVDYSGNSGGTAEDNVILRGTSHLDLIEIAREGDLTPGGNGTLGSLGPPAINDLGYAAFQSPNIAGASGGLLDNTRVFRGSGSSLTEIVREGELAPDGNGAFQSMNDTSTHLNHSNRVAFHARLRDTAGGSTDSSGLFMGSGGSLTQMVREGDLAPDGNGTFDSFSALFGGAINEMGQVAFKAVLRDTSGGSSDDRGIYISDGIDIVRVVREGQALAGSTVTSAEIMPGSGADGEERDGFNNAAQAAFWVELADGNSLIGLFTPDLHWREDGSGYWTTDGNWTLGIEPDPLYDVFIDPVGSVNVTGHAINETVKSLTVGSTGGGVATLNLTGSGDLHALGDVTIDADGKINVGAGRVLSAADIDNSGILTGSGTIDAVLSNRAGGEVIVDAGNALHIANNAAHVNRGTVELFGGEVRFDGALTNVKSTGLIAARDAVLRFNGGLTNDGSIGLSFGTTDVIGDVDNTGTGLIVTSGNANTTFWGDVINDGNITTSTGSTSVFFGSVSGGGNFPGGGTTFFEGDLAPGASPAAVRFGGNVVLGPFSKTLIELGGTTPGTQHDQLDVTGTLSAGGTLTVTLIDTGGGTLDPQAGDVFDIFNFTSFLGDFTTMNLPSLAGSDPDLRWHINNLKTTGELLTTFIADLNGDVSVDIADLGLLGGQWGIDGTGFPSGFNADINGDGVVDVADLGQMGGQWGLSAGTSLGDGSTVPAPSAGMIVLSLLGVVGATRPRRAA